MSKKTNFKKIANLYYFILGFALITQILTTVFKLSQTISYQHRISALQTQKQILSKEQEEIQVEISRLSSLSVNQFQVTDEFVPISTVYIIPADQTLALKY
jgi:cell division protein FtsB